MKKLVLKKVILKGFKGYEEEKTYDLSEKENIFVGGNGKGKSTIADAICWAFTGKLFEGTKNENTLMNINSKKAIVEVVFDDENGENTITRSITPSSSAIIKLNGKKVSKKKLNEIIDEDTFLMTFNPLNFLAKKPTEARNLIINNIDEDVTDEMALSKLTEAEQQNLKGVDLTKDVSKDVRKEISNLDNDLIVKKGLLENYKNELENIKIPEEVEKVNLDVLENRKKELNNLMEEANSLQLNFNSLSEKQIKISEAISKATSESVYEIDKQIAELNQRRTTIISEGKALSEKEYSAKNNFELKKELAETNCKVEALDKENSIYRQAIKDIQKKYILKAGSKCPICKRIIDSEIEKTLKEVAKKESENFVKKGLSNKDSIENLKGKAKELLNKIELVEKEEVKNKKEFEFNKNKKLKELREELVKVENEIKLLNKKRDGILEKIKGNQKELNSKKEEIRTQLNIISEKLNDKNVLINKEKSEIAKLEKEIEDKNTEIRKIQLLKDKKNSISLEIKNLNKDIDELNIKIKKEKYKLLSITNFRETKIRLIEEAISKHLDKVSFELEKVNKETAEIKSCFVVKYNNKELSCCSFSEVIKAGVEIGKMIRNSLSLEYPLFIDNSESILDMNTDNIQTIRTVVVDSNQIVKIDKNILSNMISASAEVVKSIN